MTDTAAPNRATPSLRQLALGDLDHELASTRRVLEQLPDEQLDWRPHPRSFSLGELATHLANLVRWQVVTLREPEFDLAASPAPRQGASSRAEVLRAWDDSAAALREALAATDEAALQQPWTLRKGEQVILRQPRLAILRSMGISHIIHHRAQLTVYLRLLDRPVPGLYGPSADEGRGA